MTNSITRFPRAAITAALFAAALTVTLNSGTANAQTRPPAPTMAVVDTDRLVQDSLAAKGVRLERDKYGNTYGTQVKDMEAALRKEDQDLAQQRGVLAPDVFQQRATAFQQKVAEYQSQVKEKQDRLDYSFQQSMQEIGNTIVAVSSEVAKAQGINAVFFRAQLIYFDPTMDITAPVLEKLNQRLPSVKFQDPMTLQAQGAPGAPGVPGAAMSPAPTGAAKTPAPAPAKKP